MSLSLGATALGRNQTVKPSMREKVVMASVVQAIFADQFSGSSGFHPVRTRPEVSSVDIGLLLCVRPGQLGDGAVDLRLS